LKIIGGAGAPFAGYFYDATGSYMGSFEIVILLLVAGLACLALAAPPQHPSAELKL
jgi:cyanate permease